MIFILTKENALMETRVAVLAIIVRGGSSVQPLNELLHQARVQLVKIRNDVATPG